MKDWAPFSLVSAVALAARAAIYVAAVAGACRSRDPVAAMAWRQEGVRALAAGGGGRGTARR